MAYHAADGTLYPRRSFPAIARVAALAFREESTRWNLHGTETLAQAVERNLAELPADDRAALERWAGWGHPANEDAEYVEYDRLDRIVARLAPAGGEEVSFATRAALALAAVPHTHGFAQYHAIAARAPVGRQGAWVHAL